MKRRLWLTSNLYSRVLWTATPNSKWYGQNTHLEVPVSTLSNLHMLIHLKSFCWDKHRLSRFWNKSPVMKQMKQLPELKPAESVIFSPDCFTTNNSFNLYTVPCYFQRDGFIWLSIHLEYKFKFNLMVPNMACWSYTTLISYFAKPKQALPGSTIVAYQTYR